MCASVSNQCLPSLVLISTTNTTNTRQSMKEGRNGGRWFCTFTFIHVCNVRYFNSVCLSPPSLSRLAVAIKCVQGYGIYAWYAWMALVSTSLSLSLSLYLFGLAHGYIGYLHQILAYCSLTHFRPHIASIDSSSVCCIACFLSSLCVLPHSSSRLPLYHNQRGTNNTQKKGITLFFLFSPHTCLHILTPSLLSAPFTTHPIQHHSTFNSEKKGDLLIHFATSHLSHSHTHCLSLSHSFSLTLTLTLSHPHHVSPFFLSSFRFLIILSTPLQYGENHTDPVVFAFSPCACL